MSDWFQLGQQARAELGLVEALIEAVAVASSSLANEFEEFEQLTCMAERPVTLAFKTNKSGS